MSEYYKPDDPNLVFIQSRAEIDPALVDEYAGMMRDGVQFHPAKAVAEGPIIYVYDGFHRGEAARQAGILLFVSVKPGTRAEAEWAALNANQDHGMRRSNADKQKIVKLALLHPFGSKLSNRQIAQHCGVDEKTIRRIREQLESTAAMPQSDTRIGADGRTINTANIGSTQPEYIAVWQLEQGIKQWITAKYSILQGQIETLQAIKQKQDEGPALLEELLAGDVLPGPRRKGDVVQAVNNVLAQLEQQQRQQVQQSMPVPQPADQPEWLEETSAPPDGYPTGYPADQDEVQPEDSGESAPPPPALLSQAEKLEMLHEHKPAPPPTPEAAPLPPPPLPPVPRPAAPPDWHLHVTLKHTGLCLVTLTQAGLAEPSANISTHVDQVLEQVRQALGQHVPHFNGKEKEIVQ